MGTFNRNTATPLYSPGLYRVLFNMFKKYPWIYKQFCDVRTSKQQKETDYSLWGIKNIPEKPEMSSYEFGEITPGYEIEYEHISYGYALKWSKEAKDDELYGQLKKFPQLLFDAARFTIESVAHTTINDGFSNIGYDGVSLFSDSHPSLEGTQSNLLGDVSLGRVSLENMIVLLKNQKSAEEHPIPFSEEYKLLVPIELDPLATKLLGTPNEYGTANNDISYFYNMLTHLADPYIESESNWHVVPKPFSGGITVFWREKINGKEEKDPYTDDTWYKVRFRLSAGYSEWHKSAGAGS